MTMQHKLPLQIMMSSGLAKRDNWIVTLFLLTQAFDILLDYQLIRVISNNNNNYFKQLLSWYLDSTHYIINHKGSQTSPTARAYCHSFQILTEKVNHFNQLMQKDPFLPCSRYSQVRLLWLRSWNDRWNIIHGKQQFGKVISFRIWSSLNSQLAQSINLTLKKKTYAIIHSRGKTTSKNFSF